jgi:hypothetical protein
MQTHLSSVLGDTTKSKLFRQSYLYTIGNQVLKQFFADHDIDERLFTLWECRVEIKEIASVLTLVVCSSNLTCQAWLKVYQEDLLEQFSAELVRLGLLTSKQQLQAKFLLK